MKTMFAVLITMMFNITSNPTFLNPDPIVFDKTTHDFGIVDHGVAQEAVFSLTNTSDKPLLLTKVKASCGCTGTTYEKKPIAPGKTTEIRTTYNAKALGIFKKTVSVYTNLYDKPTILTLSGEVK